MRPYIIWLSSVDGKIDSAILPGVTGDDEYETTGAQAQWRCLGLRANTLQQHFAEDQPFISASNMPAGPRPVLIARRGQRLRDLRGRDAH